MAAKQRIGEAAPLLRSRQWVALALDLGALRAKVIAAATVKIGEWVRWKCQFGCDGFGSSRMCPPHTPKPAETRAFVDGYRRAILFESPKNRSKRIAVRLERELFLAGYYKALGLGAGPCHLCDTCAFDAGCRRADKARPSMEAVGIDVFTTARKHGFSIKVVRTRNDLQHYFGLVLVD